MSLQTSIELQDPDFVREAFSSARAEILKRVELRDRMLVTSFTISIGILGGTMVSRDPMIGLLVPVFGLGSAQVVCQHTTAIHQICCWTRREILFLHWGRSRELRNLHREAITARAMAQAAMFVTPAFVAIAYGYKAAFAQTSVLLSGLWWSGILMVLATAYVQWRTLRGVLGVNRRTGYEDAYVSARRVEPSRKPGPNVVQKASSCR